MDLDLAAEGYNGNVFVIGTKIVNVSSAMKANLGISHVREQINNFQHDFSFHAPPIADDYDANSYDVDESLDQADVDLQTSSSFSSYSTRY
ncbi:MAG: hypothetical protein VW378_00915 [bacterium]